MSQQNKDEYVMLDYKFELVEPFQRIQFDPSNINSGFAKVLIYVLYPGDNRNGLYISKELIEKKVYSLFNIPIVGEWISDDSDEKYGGRFGSHGGKFEITQESFKFIRTTQAYGAIPESAKNDLHWKTVMEKDGLTKHEYLVVSGYLWLDEFPNEVNYVLDKNTWQSCELGKLDYHWDEENDKFVINDFEFSALCILNRDDNDPNKNVEPCFEQAQITNYKDEFDKKFSFMIEKIKQFELQEKNKGGEGMAKEIKNGQVADPKIDNQLPPEADINQGKDGTAQFNVVETDEYKVLKTECDKVTAQFNTLEEQYNVLKAEFDILTKKNEEMNTVFEATVKELNTIKAESDLMAKTDFYNQFDEHLKDDELYVELGKTDDDGVPNFAKMSLDELDKNLSVLFTYKTLKFAKKKNDGMPQVGVDTFENNDKKKSYNKILENYKNSKLNNQI